MPTRRPARARAAAESDAGVSSSKRGRAAQRQVPSSQRHPIGLALAGGGPFGAIYEIGALIALDEALDGVDFNDLHVYVGVSAGSFLTAALANQIPTSEIYRLFIKDERVEGALTPEVFMRPALAEFWRRARALPPLALRSLFQYLRDPLGRGAMASFASLASAIPTGVFDNDTIHDYLAKVFTEPGHSNDFRTLKHRLFAIATDLDTGEAVAFGAPGFDHVPVSKAVQASSALPGLFPPVAINGRHYVDGALRRTLHASVALKAGARLVLGINPIVPFDADQASQKGNIRSQRLVDGGLPMVLSQTFRAIIHSRMTVGLEKYRTQYPDADVVVFEPRADDHELFYSNIFSYADRNRVCEYAYQRTRRDLWQRRHALAPVLMRHGVKLNHAVLEDSARRLDVTLRPRGFLAERQARLKTAAADLKDAIFELRRWVARGSAAGG